MELPPMLRRRPTWLIAVPVVVVLLAVVGPFVYINLLRDDAPERLSFEDSSPTTEAGSDSEQPATPTELAGAYAVGGDSLAGYRVEEVLAGQNVEAVGRTSDVDGTLEIDGTTITAAEFTVDMATVESDEGRRDNQFRTRIMDTGTYPTATFALTEPIALDAIPAEGDPVTTTAAGDLTVRGVTNPVTFELAARVTGTTIQVDGTIPIEFADYEIPDASFGPATVEDHGEIEFLLAFEPA